MSEYRDSTPPENKYFADELTDYLVNPVYASSLMFERLGVDLRWVMDVPSVATNDDFEELLAARQAPVKDFTQTVIFFAGHGRTTIKGLGEWLNTDNPDLWYADFKQKPVKVMWRDLNREHGHRQGIARVHRAAREQNIVAAETITQIAFEGVLNRLVTYSHP